jgi:hypothetical protein
MIDIVIPLGNRSTQNNQELRYCLRSIEQHLTGAGNVFIVGECPEWLTGCVHIPLAEDPRNRFRDRNIMLKMAEACKDARVSDNFLMVHDDHFLLSDYHAGEFPYYHMGPMVPNVGQYAETKKNTIQVLSIRDDVNYVINNYDCHCPIVFNKQLFMRSVALADWSKWYGYCLKTLYCVMNGVEGEYTDDLKIRMPWTANEIRGAIAGRKWFSIGDRCFAPGGMWDVLNELYPNKSKYEAT